MSMSCAVTTVAFIGNRVALIVSTADWGTLADNPLTNAREAVSSELWSSLVNAARNALLLLRRKPY
jgi:hypothetical protein